MRHYTNTRFLFNFRGVTDEEIHEVRLLLDEHDIEFYETPPSFWGISMGGIWLRDESQFERSKQLLAAYQQERSIRIRKAFAEQKIRGEVDTLFHRFKRDPIRVTAYLVVILLILYFFTVPFIQLMHV